MSIRRRFVLVLSFFSITLAVLFGWTAYGISRSSLEEQLDQTLLQTAGATASIDLQAFVVLSL